MRPHCAERAGDHTASDPPPDDGPASSAASSCSALTCFAQPAPTALQTRRGAAGEEFGAPNLTKRVLTDPTGTLDLIHGGRLASGAAQRDLTFLTGERFAAFLEAYLARRPGVWLHQHLVTDDLYRWVLQEIACYTSRILLELSDDQEHAHAWQELQPHSPFPML